MPNQQSPRLAAQPHGAGMFTKNSVLFTHLYYAAFRGVIASSYFLIDTEMVQGEGFEPSTFGL